MLSDTTISKEAPAVSRAATTVSGRRSGKALKRALDFLVAIFLLVLLAPLFALLALIVLFDDGRPVLYRRRVVGRQGEFDAFKFRSMRRDADEILLRDPVLRAEFEKDFKLKEDPRLTRFGSFLRRHSLDELPQIFNVLAGQMSLVGPRMITAPELQKYGVHKDLLLTVPPGITGYWQINGRQDVSYAERVTMDVYYIQNWSFWLDLKILLQTPLKVLKREGAY
jgi:lipopolysaccharide/colanic/teichoic acid biosynthesis glycosyltransferase